MLRLLCSMLLFMLAVLLARAQHGEQLQAHLRVDSSFRYAPLTNYLWLFTDTTNRLSWQEVKNQPFRLMRTAQPNFGSDAYTHWATFSCTNISNKPRPLVLELDNVFFDEASCYIIREDQVVHYAETLNWHVAPGNRPISSRYYPFPFTLQPQQTVAVYVRMRFGGGIFVCPITLWEPAHYQEQYATNTVVYLIPCAVLSMIAIISLLLFLIYRWLVLGYYTLYTLGILGFILNIEGFLSACAQLPFAGPKGWIVCICVAWIGNLLFTQAFVFQPHPLVRSKAVTYSFLAVLASVSLLLIFTFVLPPNGTLAVSAMAFSVLCPLFVLGWLLVGLYARLAEARIYTLAITPVFGCVALIAMGGESFLPIGDKLFVLMFYTPPVEIIILGFGLGRQFFQERETLFKTVQTVQQELIQSQETERQRLAADLHDDLGGTLATIRQRLSDIRLHLRDPQAAHALDALEPLIQKSGHDLRRIAHNLMPPDFARLGLRAALEQLINHQPAHPTGFSFIVAGQVRSLPVDVELNAYRIVSELVQNIHKHAQASQAAVQLLYHENYLTITVEDNGVGSGAETNQNISGIGLKNSSLRAEYIRATLRREVSEAGTLVVLDVPYLTTPDVPRHPKPNSAD